MLRAVTLDFWGTLVDDRPSSAGVRIDALASALPAFSREQVQSAYRASWSRFLDAGAHGWGLPPAAVLNVALEELGASLRPPAQQAILAAWEQAHLTSPPVVLPGVRSALTELRLRGLLVALISDTGATPGTGLREYMVKEGLRTLFDWLTFSNETGVTKMSPQAFYTTLAALGVSPDEAVHVGDSPAPDICGAQAAGMRAGLSIQVHDRRSPQCRPDFILERMADLPAALSWLADPAGQG